MKKYLLDTHILLWMFSGDSRLSNPVREVILNTDNPLFFSMAGYWEICIKVSLGKLVLRKNWERHLDNELKVNNIQMLSIYPEHCRKLVTLPFHHRDPFDRLMIAQCLVESATFLSADQQMERYATLNVIG